ncbi:MAG: hypothetical protein NTX72_00710 [Candidatus Uhrbacteria bacterium]|nr:hypothetical protein [Candidatus Uhrbacteria bacterium]
MWHKATERLSMFIHHKVGCDFNGRLTIFKEWPGYVIITDFRAESIVQFGVQFCYTFVMKDGSSIRATGLNGPEDNFVWRHLTEKETRAIYKGSEHERKLPPTGLSLTWDPVRREFHGYEPSIRQNMNRMEDCGSNSDA